MLTAGTVVADHLCLVRQLGSGGMGSVWIAEQTRLGQHVAVKFLSTALLDHESARSRFDREAKLAAKIKSPHVVQIHDHGLTRGEPAIPYIVMELLDGQDLSKVLDSEGPLGLVRASEVLNQVCEALTKAHEAGIVHRDLKPENVFVLSEARTFVKLLDFGVAHGKDGQIDRLTQTGLLLGTAHYMSPEQLFSGKDIDARADLWALAVLTYQMLSNELPFQAETFGQLCLRVRDGGFAPISSRVNVPPGMDQWFARGLCTDRIGRFQSATEMAQAFRRVVAGEMLGDGNASHSGADIRSKARDNTGTVRVERGALFGEPGASSAEREEVGFRSESRKPGVPKTERWGSNPGTSTNGASGSKGAASGGGVSASARADGDGTRSGEALSRGTLPSGEHSAFAATSSDWQASNSNGITANTPLSALEGSFGTEARGALTFNADAAGQRPRSRGVRIVALAAAAVVVGVGGAVFWRSGEQSSAAASDGAGTKTPELPTGSVAKGSASVGAAEIVVMPTPGGIDNQASERVSAGNVDKGNVGNGADVNAGVDDGAAEIAPSPSVDSSASVGNTVTPPFVRSQSAKASSTQKAGANSSGRGSSKANADVATDQSVGGQSQSMGVEGKGSPEGSSPTAKQSTAKTPAQKKYRGF